MSYYGIKLEQTCGACPEQYDAYLNGEVVGYLRLRHGYFTVSCPWSGGEVVYEAQPEGDGLFTYEERDGFLEAACAAIAKWTANRP